MSFCGSSALLTFLSVLNRLKKKPKSRDEDLELKSNHSSGLSKGAIGSSNRGGCDDSNTGKESRQSTRSTNLISLESEYDGEEGRSADVISCWTYGVARKARSKKPSDVNSPTVIGRYARSSQLPREGKLHFGSGTSVRKIVGQPTVGHQIDPPEINGKMSSDLKVVGSHSSSIAGYESRSLEVAKGVSHEDTAKVLKEAWELLNRLNGASEDGRQLSGRLMGMLERDSASEISLNSNSTERHHAKLTERSEVHHQSWSRQSGIGRMQQTQDWVLSSDSMGADFGADGFSLSRDSDDSDRELSHYGLAEGPEYQPFQIVLPNDVHIALKKTIERAPFILETLRAVEKFQQTDVQNVDDSKCSHSEGSTETTLDLQGMITFMEELLLEEPNGHSPLVDDAASIQNMSLNSS